MAVWNDVEVKAQLSATPVNNPTYPDTLSGDLAVLPIVLNPQSDLVPIDGGYKGTTRYKNMKRKRPLEVTVNVLDAPESKKYVGSNEMYLYLQLKTYDDDGVTLLNTEKATLQVLTGGRVFSTSAPTRIAVVGVLTAYAKT